MAIKLPLVSTVRTRVLRTLRPSTKLGRTTLWLGGLSRRDRSAYLRVPRAAMTRREFCRSRDSGAPHMDMRQSGVAEKQNLERSGAAASVAGRFHVSLET